jgi:hypothetical protein
MISVRPIVKFVLAVFRKITFNLRLAARTVP